MLGLHVILLLVLRLRPNLAAEYTGACVQMPSVQGRCYKKLFTNELPLRERLEKCPHGRLALHDRGDVITAVSAAIGIPMDCENPSDATSADAGTHYLNVGLRDDAMEWSNGDPLFYDFLEDANREAAQGYHFQLTGEETCLVYRQRKKGCLGDTDTWHFRARCPVEDVHISVLCSGISAWSFSDTVHLDVRVFQPNLRFACFISWIAGLLMLTVVIYLYINVHYELLGRFYAISSTIVELSRAVDAAAIPEPQLDGMVKQIKSVTLEGVWAEREAVNFAMDEHFTGSPLCEVPLDQRIGWRLGKAAKVQLADEDSKQQTLIRRLPSPVKPEKSKSEKSEPIESLMDSPGKANQKGSKVPNPKASGSKEKLAKTPAEKPEKPEKAAEKRPGGQKEE